MDSEIAKTPTAIRKVLYWIKGEPERTIEVSVDRRQGGDRRVSSIAQRLRRGLWLEYHRKTDAGKFDTFSYSLRARDQLLEASINEAVRYHFMDRSNGKELRAQAVVSAAVDVVWNQFPSRRDRERQAAFIVDAVADYLLGTYDISGIDKRKEHRNEQQAAS